MLRTGVEPKGTTARSAMATSPSAAVRIGRARGRPTRPSRSFSAAAAITAEQTAANRLNRAGTRISRSGETESRNHDAGKSNLIDPIRPAPPNESTTRTPKVAHQYDAFGNRT